MFSSLVKHRINERLTSCNDGFMLIGALIIARFNFRWPINLIVKFDLDLGIFLRFVSCATVYLDYSPKISFGNSQRTHQCSIFTVSQAFQAARRQFFDLFHIVSMQCYPEKVDLHYQLNLSFRRCFYVCLACLDCKLFGLQAH